MKNKEIEELLNYLKDDNEYYDEEEEVLVNCGELILEKEDIDLLLSYIEQLENNRDKAIEYIDNYLECEYFNYDILETNTIYNRDLFKVKNILKGDSDE